MASQAEVIVPIEEPHSVYITSIRGLRNGIYYGGKVRFMHSLVMAILFRKGPLKDKAKMIVDFTIEHARNLGLYVFIYKVIVRFLASARSRESKIHNFIAGGISGFTMFGKKTPVNYQLSLYLLSRITVGIIDTVSKRKGKSLNLYPWLTAICWGLVMFLFEDDPSTLQASLKTSMDFLYKESDSYKSWTDFVPIYIPQPIANFIDNQIKNIRANNL
jgi:peroxisomal membrane protein 4